MLSNSSDSSNKCPIKIVFLPIFLKPSNLYIFDTITGFDLIR